MKNITLIYDDNNIKIYKYKPSHMFPLLKSLDRVSIGRYLRYQYELFMGGYYWYYLDVDDKIVSQNMIIPGGRRLKYATKTDVVIGGPYYTIPECRRKGYTKLLLKKSLLLYESDWEYAYDYIDKENLASIRTTLSLGFEKIGEANIVGPFHKICNVDSNGKFNVYRINRKELEKHDDDEKC